MAQAEIDAMRDLLTIADLLSDVPVRGAARRALVEECIRRIKSAARVWAVEATRS